MNDTSVIAHANRDVRALLEVVHRATSGGKHHRYARRLFAPGLHPRGIKEFAAPPAMRMASALVDLLGSLDDDTPDDRLRALRAVKEEVLHNSSSHYRLNTARVLLEVMKDLVRAQGDEARQVELAIDFLAASSGKPRLIRRLLRRYQLLEMPEAWNQVAYDHRVHDANSTGRKTPTHLIMDAWIKGIRYLGVVYYNRVCPEAAAELFEAGEIMGVQVRVGIDLTTWFRGRPVRLLLFPRGVERRDEYLAHLELPSVRAFMDEGAQVNERFRLHVLSLLERFNARHLVALNQEFGLEVPPLDPAAFGEFVGKGQASRLHLAEFVHETLLPHLRARTAQLSAAHAAADAEGRARIEGQLRAMNELVPEAIKDRYLSPRANPDLPDPLAPEGQACGPGALLDRVAGMSLATRVVLSPTGLSAADVLEILWEGRGRISHIELLNLREISERANPDLPRINLLRQLLNDGNGVGLKRLGLDVLRDLEGRPGAEDQAASVRRILRDLPSLQAVYSSGNRLRSRLCSGSTGRSRRSRGMGLVVVPTLPRRSRRRVQRDGRLLPVRTTVFQQVTWQPRFKARWHDRVTSLPLVGRLAWERHPAWVVAHNATRYLENPDGLANVAALGGVAEEAGTGLVLEPGKPAPAPGPWRWRYLPASTREAAKVALGFVPAFLTFLLTQHWWFLAWFGAVIWFGITGLRNILQSAVGGGGLRRSPLLRINDLVSWSRVADSLLFTGFSVPLLDLLVKTILLDRGLGVTVATAPWALYSTIALANGIYISTHNTIRGLPPAAVVGNFFRTMLSIPLAFALSAALGWGLGLAGLATADAQALLQLGAAIISKAASDTVAGVIEGTADRWQNMRRAENDFSEKLARLRAVHARLELLFPEQDVVGLLEEPKKLVRTVQASGEELVRDAIVNALDFMYFWYRQPRAQVVFRRKVRAMSAEERHVTLGLLRVLERKRTVSELFLNGLVGRRFEQALGFYLQRVDGYLAALKRLA